MNNRSIRPVLEKLPAREKPSPLAALAWTDRRGTVNLAHEQLRSRRILIVTDNQISAKLVGDAFEANAYEVLVTEKIAQAIHFTTTRNPGSILLMFSSLAATCKAACQIKPCASAPIIGFSATPVSATDRNAAIQDGCDDYRDAFSRNSSRV